MTSSLAEKLRSGFPNLTKSEKAVANYMVTHLKSLPYETAASIAETELESTPLLISDRLARIRKASKRDSKLWENFDLEIMATLGVYELLGGTVWKRAVDGKLRSVRRRLPDHQRHRLRLRGAA